MNKTEKVNLAKISLSVFITTTTFLLHLWGMDHRQSFVFSSLVLVVIWWSTGVVKKIPSSLLLIGCFLIAGIPPKTVFSFPLSENFILIAVSYLFSRGIANSGLMERFALPFLRRYAKTPVSSIFTMVSFFFVSIYLVPQPIARMIIVLAIMHQYLNTTSFSDATRFAVQYAGIAFFALVNMSVKDADIILNHALVGFAGIEFSNSEWTRMMLVPTTAYLAVAILLYIIIFRKELLGFRTDDPRVVQVSAGNEPVDRRQKIFLAILTVTVILWAVGASMTIVIIGSTCLMFLSKHLTMKDINAIDVNTIVFLTAAFGIGGALNACGIADLLFARLQGLLPRAPSFAFLMAMTLASVAIHMVLGSNTTTLSVIVPALLAINNGVYPVPTIMLLAFVSVAFHAILPFHCVTIAIGSAKDYFPTSYIIRYGVPGLLLLFAAVALFYLPWWSLIGMQ